MELAGLRAFLAVADGGSVSRAAEALHRSQPAISKRLAQIERSLGLRLFDRIGRRVHLTDAGRALLPHARRVLLDIEDARCALTHLRAGVTGTLRFGTSHHVGLHRLPPALRAFSAAHPLVDLDLRFMDSEIACQSVLAGELELAVVTLPPQSLTRLHQQAIWRDELVVVAASDHPLATRPRLKPAALAAYPAVLPDATTYTHRLIAATLSRHHLQPRLRFAGNYLETLKMLVATGLGWSVLPRTLLDDDVIELPLPQLLTVRPLGAVWHSGRTLSKAALAMLEAFTHFSDSLPPATDPRPRPSLQ